MWRLFSALGAVARKVRVSEAPRETGGPEAFSSPAADALAAPAVPGDGRDGAVWIEGGSVRVRNPSGLGRWPSVRLEDGVGLTLLVNGERRTGDVVLREEDRVELRGDERIEAGRVDVDVAPDGLAAWVTVHAPERVTTVAADVWPSVRVRLAGETRRERVAGELRPDHVRAALAGAGVVLPAADSVVQAALDAPGSRILAVRGRPPQRGEPAVLWVFGRGRVDGPVRAERDERAPGVACDRPLVEIGQPVVAVVRPGRPATPGETVTGKPVPPPPTWCPALVSGPGTVASADGKTIIAACAGHPRVEVGAARVYATVSPELRIPGDVDGELGDLTAEGDIWVGGDVSAGRRLRATGSVEVVGKVVQARIEAGGDIRIHGGAANSLLLAGGPALVYARASALCGQLASLLGEAARGSAAGRVRGDRRLYGVARRICKELEHAEGWLEPEVRRAYEAVALIAQSGMASAELAGIGHGAAELTGLLERAAACMREVLERRGRCFVRHLDGTRVEASGDVEVAAPGARFSTVMSLGAVRVHGTLRGGQVWAFRGAEIDVAGTEDGLPTRVEVGPQAPFRAGLVRPGTVVVRAGAVRRFAESASDVALDDAAPAGEVSSTREDALVDGLLGGPVLPPGAP